MILFVRNPEKKLFWATRPILFLIFFAAATPSPAKRDEFGYGPETFDYDPTLGEQWKEVEVDVPAYPKVQDLLPVPMPASDTLKVYVDRNSLSLGKDRVTRFSLVVESSNGARSVFYDGFRCDTREYKTYAVGTTSHEYTPVKSSKWQPIPLPSQNAFRFHLAKHYICGDHNFARPLREVLRLLTQ